MPGDDEQTNESNKQANELLEQWLKLQGLANKDLDFHNKQYVKLNKNIKEGLAGYKEQKALLNQLKDSIEDNIASTNKYNKLAKEGELQKLQELKSALEREAAYRGTTEAVRTAGAKMTVQTLQGVGQFVKGLQDDASGTQLATGLFNAGIEVATSAAHGVGGAMTALAPVLMEMGPYGMAAAAALEVLGKVIPALADTAGKLAKFGFEILSKEVEKTYKAFNQMSASGAMFADGMTGMRTAAGNAGLTVEQFSGVVKNSSESIAAAGFGMSEGAKKIGGALKAGGATMKQDLLNLGYGFEEQGQLVADVMKQMRGSMSGPLKASNAEVAAQTEKYAENLRIIASITGEDAKKKMAEAQDAANNLAFQQKLAGMDEKQRQDVVQSMSLMNAQQKKDFMETMVFGKVINTQGAVLAATIPDYQASLRESAAAANQGVLDTKKQADIMAAHSAQIQSQGMQQTGIAMAGMADSNSQYGQGIMDTINNFNKTTKDSVDSAKKTTKDQEKTTDDLTKGVTGAEQAAQDLKMALQRDLTPAITDFANVSKAMLGQVRDMLDDLGYGSKKKSAAGNYGSLGAGSDITEEQALQNFIKGGGKKGGQYFYKGFIRTYAKGGKIGAGDVGVAGEAGPELISGPSSVLSNASYEKLVVALDAMKEKKGVRFAENDFDWTVNMQDGGRNAKGQLAYPVGSTVDRVGTLKDRTSGFDQFSPKQLMEEMAKRPENADMKRARDQMDDEMGMGKNQNDTAAKMDQTNALLSELASHMQEMVRNSSASQRYASQLVQLAN